MIIEYATIFKVDLDAERARINAVPYTKAQKRKLLRVCDFLERGDIGGAARYIQRYFRYSSQDGCHENEYLGEAVATAFERVADGDYYVDWTKSVEQYRDLYARLKWACENPQKFAKLGKKITSKMIDDARRNA